IRIENTCASQPLSGITMISAIRYEVEIHPPSSMPAPIAHWMVVSEAWTIWMLSTAMKAPSVAPNTASQVFADTAWDAAPGVGVGAAEGGAPLRSVDPLSMAGGSVVMAI